MKKYIAIVLLLALLASLAGCGQTEVSAFRALEVLGEKQFSVICRGGDKLAPLIGAALKTLAGNGQLASISARWLGKDRCCLEGDASALRDLLSDPAALRRMGDAARAAFEASDCRPDRNLARLLSVYASARSAHDA